ncbi:MAG: UPF0058 family protein [Methanoregula sp.]|uniref:UPF0058 family protein n=1 Tax=Methanoregula sp. TaxID=2052170 RepID=UPI003BB09FEC
MQKEELLHLHMLMVHIRKYYENTSNEEIVTERYDALEISPVHIHKDKKAHKDALLTLGEEVVNHISGHHHVNVVNYSPKTATAPTQQAAVEH